MTARSILVPAKFITLMLQLILTCVIFESKYENTLNFPSDLNAEGSITAGVTICVVFLCLEMIILFTGLTADFEKTILIQVLLHSVGCVIVAWFILDSWAYDLIWMIFSFFCLIPLVLEVFPIVSATVFQRTVIRQKM